MDKLYEVDRKESEENDRYRILNALVLIIGISKYNGLEHLESVKLDMKNMKNLWENGFNYKVITNEISPNDNEYYADEATLFAKTDEARGY